MERHAFRAMGTEVEILLEADPWPDAVLGLASAEAEFERLEALLSRFRPESQLSRLNAEGALPDADEALVEVVELAFAARERTGGLFDPSIHDALVAAGYDRSFELLTPRRASSSRPGESPVGPAHGGGRGDCSPRGRHLTLPEGSRLDLGGIAKGYAVDRAVALLAPLGSCLVNAGGDLAVGGPERVWPIGVETPLGPISLGLRRGALATTGRDKRRWYVDGDERHHLVDPRTGRPVQNGVERVTVTAPTAVEAEVAAKAVFLGGRAAAERLGIPALLVYRDGQAEATRGLL
jgi:FAD:protein FMN transferase